MNITAQQIKSIEEFVAGKLDSLNWQHTLGVREIALKLAKEEKADRQIVEVAGLLHDVGKAKGDEGHIERSEMQARKFLEKENYEQNFVEEVIYCIAVHEYPWIGKADLIKTTEAKVLCDADVIQKLSTFGLIKHSIKYQEIFKQDYFAGLEKIKSKMLKCSDRVLTKSGEKLAKEKYKIIKEILNIK